MPLYGANDTTRGLFTPPTIVQKSATAPCTTLFCLTSPNHRWLTAHATPRPSPPPLPRVPWSTIGVCIAPNVPEPPRLKSSTPDSNSTHIISAGLTRQPISRPRYTTNKCIVLHCWDTINSTPGTPSVQETASHKYFVSKTRYHLRGTCPALGTCLPSLDFNSTPRWKLNLA